MTDDKFDAGTGQVGAATRDTKMQVAGKLDQVTGTAQQMLGDAKQTAASAADEAKATASELGHSAYEKTADIAQKAAGTLRENPFAVTIAAGLVGMAIGFLLARPSDDRAIQIGRARLSYRDR